MYCNPEEPRYDLQEPGWGMRVNYLAGCFMGFKFKELMFMVDIHHHFKSDLICSLPNIDATSHLIDENVDDLITGAMLKMRIEVKRGSSKGGVWSSLTLLCVGQSTLSEYSQILLNNLGFQRCGENEDWSLCAAAAGAVWAVYGGHCCDQEGVPPFLLCPLHLAITPPTPSNSSSTCSYTPLPI